MIHGRRQVFTDDSESLQADVMRFMAIIAFCLIAILALVKHAEPGETNRQAERSQADVAQPEVREVQPEPDVPPQAAPQPTPFEAIEPPEPAPETEETLLLATAPDAEPPEPEQPEPEQTEQPQYPPAPLETLLEEKTEEPAESEEITPAEVAETPTDSDEEGLTLRFASDGDFLRLIAKGDIRVYAFQDTDVLTLSESYRFLDTHSPGQVYELLPPSIPTLIVDALKQARTNIDGYRWGIALPGHISNQIERHLGQSSRGQLVIDRYGDVHHVAAS